MNANFKAPGDGQSTLFEAACRERERARRALVGTVLLTAIATLVIFVMGMAVTQSDVTWAVMRALLGR
ncbi:hypothetical protein H9L15_08670 [Sphingomonas daechungensis]|uniref:Uncharacterized protein n=1 Tax=Sphingomonas daechungensis TaxID=1176646 RepID=A0ABX6SYW6_9SPHN|nr:hypothetical protein [Sphingomonas daechungensis]QNP42389.1 hypothetical protein H9L15_08670 [Sphingomonas daechungensis]